MLMRFFRLIRITKAAVNLFPFVSVIENQGFSKDVCRSMVAMLDADQSGKLGLEEFRALLNDIAKWKAVFKLYDRDSSGKLSAFELREALNSAGYKLNNRILNALAHRYSSRDGQVAFDDFIMCSVKIKTMMGKLDSVFLRPTFIQYKFFNSLNGTLFSIL